MIRFQEGADGTPGVSFTWKTIVAVLTVVCSIVGGVWTAAWFAAAMRYDIVSTGKDLGYKLDTLAGLVKRNTRDRWHKGDDENYMLNFSMVNGLQPVPHVRITTADDDAGPPAP